ncbi:MAG: RIP metalloprotease RseP [Bdellovibrionales bacterium]|nr:RIP metalloprotease RseP [Bdellovibrionales bacterium]
MEIILQWLQDGLSGLGPLFILLGLLIFVHELGHFLVAKFYGVRVETFSLGFGKKILQFKKDETVYCISLIPLGGYVKMYGDDPTQPVPDDEKKNAFLEKPVGQRIAIVLAGPLMNLFFAGVLFFMIAMVGQEVPGPYLGDVQASSKAYELGFRSGDKVVSIDGEEFETWKAIFNKIKASPQKELTFKIKRETSGEMAELKVTPQYGPNPDVLASGEQVGVIEGMGIESLAPMVGVPSSESVAYQAGLRPLDYISKVNGKEVPTLRQLEPILLAEIKAGKNLKLSVGDVLSEKPGKDKVIKINFEEVGKDLDLANGAMAALGLESSEVYVMRTKPSGPADQAGLKSGDKFVSLDKTEITEWQNVVDTIKNFNPESQFIAARVIRDGKMIDLKMKPEMTDLLNSKGQDEQRFTVGIYPGMSLAFPNMHLQRTSNVIEAFKIGVKKSIDWTGIIAMGFVKMVQGEVSTRNIGSLITIGRYASHSFEAGISQFLRMMAIISINLFLINLLPVPVLDGGHLMFFGIEALRGAPLSLKKMEIAQQFGLVILMSLMAFALFNDISNWFAAW